MRIGLTGGVASGKSTVSAMLRELGATVVDSDLLAREVVAPGTPGLARVVEAFGPDVLASGGALDRARLGAIVFADPAQRRRLEAITHPLIRQRSRELEEAARAEGQLVVNDVPLLVETGMAPMFDEVLVVDVDPEEQVRRMVLPPPVGRGWTEADARARMAAQASREERLAAATYVIDNSGTLEDLRERVTEVFEELKEKSAREEATPGG